MSGYPTLTHNAIKVSIVQGACKWFWLSFLIILKLLLDCQCKQPTQAAASWAFCFFLGIHNWWQGQWQWRLCTSVLVLHLEAVDSTLEWLCSACSLLQPTSVCVEDILRADMAAVYESVIFSWCHLSTACDEKQTVSGGNHCKSNQLFFRNSRLNWTNKGKLKFRNPELKLNEQKFKLNEQTKTAKAKSSKKNWETCQRVGVEFH